MTVKGADYSWDRPDLNCLWGQGVRFLVRYGSRDPSKNLTKPELDAILARGMSICVVWQEGKTQMLRGYSGGQADARDADSFVNGLGLRGIPVYFSCDQDYEACSSADKTKIDEYLTGAQSIVGKPRMGGYGDDTFCKRGFDSGKLMFGWQTYAWSEGMWEARCQLRQVNNNVTVCGGKIDWDEARAADYGQWPRPAGPATTSDAGVTVAVAYEGEKEHYAGIWTDGKVNYRPPGGSWRAVDPAQTGAKSGCGIAVSKAGKVTITYTNGNGAACVYVKNPGSGSTWAWASISPNNSFT